MEPNHTASGATEIFKMPVTDATSPNLMGESVPALPTLTIVKGPNNGSVFELEGSTVSIGRDVSNAVFLNDMTVSRHHARLDLSGVSSGFASIEDLGSLNGTWVDGAIVSKATLRDGSTVQVGTFRMVFHTNRRSSRIETGA